MLRTILITTALLCIAQAASAQELTAEQRSACMDDYEKYCKGVTPGGGRIIACLAKESDKSCPPVRRSWRRPRRNEGATGVHAGRQPKPDRRASTPRPASAEPCVETFEKGFENLNINQY